ncbi:YggT family protein [Phenylobacterium montanum]|uniref:YggT family protein n=1 Tax=Phenylobacterium montanum TaxID=2823693 RepID=A0A975FZB6_9CAUL|nr:YggT family protein [Caulobacter sp. S6]QUD87697.1 YggT family protein [Caulobacter sp. S6]
MIDAVLWLFNAVVGLYIFVVFVAVIMSWLTAFNIVNPRSPIVMQIERILYALTDPALRPIRRVIPSLGGLDISPIILLLLLEFIQRLVNNLLLGRVFYSI